MSAERASSVSCLACVGRRGWHCALWQEHHLSAFIVLHVNVACLTTAFRGERVRQHPDGFQCCRSSSKLLASKSCFICPTASRSDTCLLGMAPGQMSLMQAHVPVHVPGQVSCLHGRCQLCRGHETRYVARMIGTTSGHPAVRRRRGSRPSFWGHRHAGEKGRTAPSTGHNLFRVSDCHATASLSTSKDRHQTRAIQTGGRCRLQKYMTLQRLFPPRSMPSKIRRYGTRPIAELHPVLRWQPLRSSAHAESAVSVKVMDITDDDGNLRSAVDREDIPESI